MGLYKRKFFKVTVPGMSIILTASMLLMAAPATVSAQTLPLLDPAAVRAAVQAMGMEALGTVVLNQPVGIQSYVRILDVTAADPLTNPPTPAPPAALVNMAAARGKTVAQMALEILGKAFFWDQQVGSDGNACASCHFQAGEDIRTTNVLNPGSRNVDVDEQTKWNATNSGGVGGPNYALTPADYPFFELADPLETNYAKRDILFDTDDVTGSIGTFHATFGGSPVPNYGLVNATGTYDTALAPVIDIFTVDTNPGAGVTNRNVRSNGPRQAGSNINAVFYFNAFWDGRAENTFNALDMHGTKNLNPFIYFNGGGILVRDIAPIVGDAALASQATAPVNSATSDEMAFAGRTMPDVGRKLFRLTGPGSGATATAQIDTVVGSPTFGTLTGITLTAGGTNYLHGATIIISGGGGAGAVATATVSGAGVVTAITPVDQDAVNAGIQSGGGYITAPTVTITSTGYANSPGYAANPIRPLGAQTVDATDSLLGTFKNPAGTNGGRGISLSYVNLVQWAFVPTYWDAAGTDAFGTPIALLTPGGFHIMEENFPLFWGLALNAYQSLLIADQTPYDLFMGGNNDAFGPWNSPEAQDVMRGLLTFIATENTDQQANPIFNNIGAGACQLCHSGPELTELSKINVAAKFFVTTDMTVKMDHNRELAIVAPASNFDVGFSNVGSRPTYNDVGIGGTILGGIPLSITRQGQIGFVAALAMLPLFPAKPNPERGTNTDGAFKIPALRNIELRGPYFHNGGSLTLKQAVEFYLRHGDFGDFNDPNIDVGLAMVGITASDADLIVKFLLQLTDPRVKNQAAPFDHPSISLPNGHAVALPANTTSLGAAYVQDLFMVLPATGAAGSATPLQGFMGVSTTPVPGPNNDHFDP